MRRDALLRYRAERALRSDFAALRPRVTSIVRARLRAHGVALDADDLEACYAQAWHGLYATVAKGEQVQDRAAWLVLVTYRRAIDESRSRTRQIADLGAQADDLARSARPDADLAAQLDDRARLRHLFEAMRAGLTARERRVVSLCYLQGLSRSEAAARMGISEARMRKLMDGWGGRPGVARKFGELLDAIRAGGWCEQQSSLVRAYAFGLLDPEGERHRLAAVHLRECPSCRAFVACLRGLAVLLPPLPMPMPLPLPLDHLPAAVRPRARSSATAGTGKTLTAKLAVIGTIALGGGGYALFAGNAPGHTVRHARPAANVPARIGSAYVPGRRRRRRSALRRQAVPSPPPSTAAHRPAYAPPPPTRRPTRSGSPPLGERSGSSPLGEFTPERAPRR